MAPAREAKALAKSLEAGTTRVERGKEPEEEGGRDREGEGEEQHPGIERDRIHPDQRSRNPRQKRSQGNPGERHPEGPAHAGEKEAFDGLAKVAADPEMVEIADLLIERKTGKFDPSEFEDRYENALVDMLEAKKAGRKPPKPVAAPKRTKVVELAAVLRKSLEKEGIGKPAKGRSRRPAKRGRKAA